MATVGNKRIENHINSRETARQRLAVESRKTAARFDTFANFPSDVPVSDYLLACNGFCYTGCDDLVTCYNCGVDVRDWQPGDDGNLQRHHRPNCTFAKVNDCASNGNENSLATKTLKKKFTVPTGAEVLMFGLGLNHETNRPVPVSTDVDSSDSTDFVTDGKDVVPEQQGCYITTCHGPKPAIPEMCGLSDRLRSFENKRALWRDNYHHRLTPLQFAEAGFFYTGKKDKVKCWYCNKTLGNWEQDDDAWTEHSRWSPTCEFVRQNKGTVNDCQHKH